MGAGQTGFGKSMMNKCSACKKHLRGAEAGLFRPQAHKAFPSACRLGSLMFSLLLSLSCKFLLRKWFTNVFHFYFLNFTLLKFLLRIYWPALNGNLLLPRYNASLSKSSPSSRLAVRWCARDCHVYRVLGFFHLKKMDFVVGNSKLLLHLNLYSEVRIS